MKKEKQERQANLRRQKDEEREAEERHKVLFLFTTLVKHLSQNEGVLVLVRKVTTLIKLRCCGSQEEAAQEQKAKEEAAALEEFDKWKGAFSVDTEGTAENDVEEEGQGLLVEFVEYIKVIH